MATSKQKNTNRKHRKRKAVLRAKRSAVRPIKVERTPRPKKTLWSDPQQESIE